jgi:hypothetical protein|tara:strand:- start:40 stop:279 length:240 start_codon:yes stop_codon:yes gene_type:complete
MLTHVHAFSPAFLKNYRRTTVLEMPVVFCSQLSHIFHSPHGMSSRPCCVKTVSTFVSAYVSLYFDYGRVLLRSLMNQEV